MKEDSSWLSMWTSPRATIRAIVQENPKKGIWALSFIYGLTSLFNGFQSFPIAMQIGLIGMIVVTVILAAFWGYLVFAVWSWITVLIGKLFKGKGTFQTVRAAYAWSCVPLSINALLWILLVIFYGNLLFYGPQQHSMLSGSAVTILFLILIGKIVFAIWSIVLFLQALAEVQGFSVLRAIGNVIVASIVLAILVGILWTLLALSLNGCTPGAVASGFDLENLRAGLFNF